LTARSNSKRRMARTAASGSSLVQFFNAASAYVFALLLKAE
jgi:hypothetical protein